jgi:hypothetical protein
MRYIEVMRLPNVDSSEAQRLQSAARDRGIIYTARFYRESAASLGSGIATRLSDKRNASGAKTSGTRKIKDVVMAGPLTCPPPAVPA